MSSNFRHHLLSLSLLVGIAAPWAAFAQAPISSVGSGSVEDRVTQLERISNAHSQLLTQLQQQLSDNQTDIDSLRGQIQESQYQLNQVVERQKQILLQIDGLSSGGGGAAGAQPSSSGDQGAAATSGASGLVRRPGETGDANTDYNAAIALVKDPSRQDDAMAAFRTSSKSTRIQPISRTPTTGSVS
jgi:TolA-binding protein